MKLNTTVRQSHRNSVLDMLLIFADEMLRAITYTVLAVPGSILLLWGKTHRAYGGSIYALAQRNK